MFKYCIMGKAIFGFLLKTDFLLIPLFKKLNIFHCKYTSTFFIWYLNKVNKLKKHYLLGYFTYIHVLHTYILTYLLAKTFVSKKKDAASSHLHTSMYTVVQWLRSGGKGRCFLTSTSMYTVVENTVWLAVSNIGQEAHL